MKIMVPFIKNYRLLTHCYRGVACSKLQLTIIWHSKKGPAVVCHFQRYNTWLMWFSKNTQILHTVLIITCFWFTFIRVGNKELPLEQLLRGSVSLGNSRSWRRFQEQAPGPHKETKKLVFQLQLFRAKLLVSKRVTLKYWTIVTSIANANETVIYILKHYFI